MRLLDTLLVVGSTIERESIYGSAYKRLALIEAAEKRDAPERAAIAEMKKHYAAAEAIARARIEKDPTATTNVWYPAMNRLAAEVALDGGTAADRRASRADDRVGPAVHAVFTARLLVGGGANRVGDVRRAAQWKSGAEGRGDHRAVRGAPRARQRAEDVGVCLRQRDVRALQISGEGGIR